MWLSFLWDLGTLWHHYNLFDVTSSQIDIILFHFTSMTAFCLSQGLISISTAHKWFIPQGWLDWALHKDSIWYICVECNLHFGDSSFSSGSEHNLFLQASLAVSNVSATRQCQQTKGILRTYKPVYLSCVPTVRWRKTFHTNDLYTDPMLVSGPAAAIGLVLLLLLFSWWVFAVSTLTSRR